MKWTKKVPKRWQWPIAILAVITIPIWAPILLVVAALAMLVVLMRDCLFGEEHLDDGWF